VSERDDGPLYTLRPEGVRLTGEPVAWMDVEEDGTRHGLRAWSDGTHREVPLYMVPPDHRKAMRMALEYVSWHANGECRVGTGPIPAPNDVVAALRAALGEKK
jgi:hypothetical protein